MSSVSRNWRKLVANGDVSVRLSKKKHAFLKQVQQKSQTSQSDQESNESVSVPSVSVSATSSKILSLFPTSNNASTLGKYVAIDCEMVGVGPEGIQSALARVTLVNFHGHVLLDEYVKPMEPVTDYRTQVSGITEQLMETASEFSKVQKKVIELLNGRILIGHGLRNDFQALLYTHPHKLTRDTALYKPFKTEFGKGRTPALRKLAQLILKLEIQQGAHDSIDDARVAMLLYRKVKDAWERVLLSKKTKETKESDATEKNASV